MRLGVLISGSGRTLLNLMDRRATGRLRATVACVVSSKPRSDANDRVFRRCETDGVPISTIRPRDHASVETFAAAQADWLDSHRVELVCMAGYLSLWPIPDRYRWRVINIHPALLPAFGGQGFYGHRVHQAVLAAGVSESGCTVHYADNVYDHGPVILQRRVPVKPDDTPDTLAARVFEQELEAYPEAINLIADGRVIVDESGGTPRVTVR